MKKYILFSIFFVFSNILLLSQDYGFMRDNPNYQTIYHNLLEKNINFKDFLLEPVQTKLELGFSFSYLDKIQRFEYKEEENPFRRAEILFFGSLTFATFGGWLFFSLFNVLIYNEAFGRLRRDQFLVLYLGSSVISFSVVISDLFINLKPKMKKKNIEFF